MKNVAKLNRNEREELFIVTAHEVRLPEAMVEKDFWVCWSLDYLFHESPWKNHFAFKGGTSLSKCFDLVDRFSEDISKGRRIDRWAKIFVTHSMSSSEIPNLRQSGMLSSPNARL